MARGLSRKQAATKLPGTHPTAVAFLDESGSIASDRFFAVGCLKIAEPHLLTRSVQLFRDQNHWYKEFRFTDATKGTIGIYKGLAAVAASNPLTFSCFVADPQRG